MRPADHLPRKAGGGMLCPVFLSTNGFFLIAFLALTKKAIKRVSWGSLALKMKDSLNQN